MDVKKLIESIAPPHDCATCEHLDLEQTMPLTDPPIPIAYCHIACGDDVEVTYNEQAATFWAGDAERCDSYKTAATRESLLKLVIEQEKEIKDLKQELRDHCYECDQCGDEDHEPMYNEGMD